jgi:hypothetical protein
MEQKQQSDDTKRVLRQIAAGRLFMQQDQAPAQHVQQRVNPFAMTYAIPPSRSMAEQNMFRDPVLSGMGFPQSLTSEYLKLQILSKMNQTTSQAPRTVHEPSAIVPPQPSSLSYNLGSNVPIQPKIPTTFHHIPRPRKAHQQESSSRPELSVEGKRGAAGKATAPDESSAREQIMASNDPKAPRRNEDRWLAALKELQKYKEQFGDCVVPRGYPDNPRLASWVAEQRKQYKLMIDGKGSSITPERVAKLNEIGFTWNAQEAAWDKHLTDLKKFKAKEGHCTAPLNHPDYPKLGLWVKEQRRHYALIKQGKHSHMTEARARALDEIDFCWDTHEAVWGERLRELCAFKAEHGHCSVPMNYPKNPKLASWVHHQRRQYKKRNEGRECHITLNRIRALESIGFTWNPRDKTTTGQEKPEKMKNQVQKPSKKRHVETENTTGDLKPRKRQQIT